MVKEKIAPTHTIAWNGISLKIPSDWEIDSLDTAHLLMGENSSPNIEIKWAEAPGQFTLEKYLKKFIATSQKLLDIRIHELPTPVSFSHPLPCFEFFFFSWESRSSRGKGVLVFCTHCKRLTLIRFFSGSPLLPNSIPALILSSFSDHPEDDRMAWQVFGLDFSTPHSFVLSDYSFKPGSFILRFDHKKTHLTFFSWGPAQFLLSEISLPEFAAIRLPQLKGFATAGTHARGNYLEWSFRHDRFKNAGILPFMDRFARFCVFRICHDPQTNRIFGILADSPKKFEHELIQAVADG